MLLEHGVPNINRRAKYMKNKEILKIYAIVFLLGPMVAIFADTDFPLHGRISYDAESTLIMGVNDEDWSRATLNTLVLAGDTLWTDKGGSTEIEFPGSVFLRMADASKIKITKISPELTFHGITGSFYIERTVRSSGVVSFITPACRISFDPETCTRIDIGEGGSTRISTRWGKAYVTTERGGNEVVSSGKQCWVDVGYLPSEVVSFATTEMDAFDRWNRGRSELLSAPVKTPPKYVEVSSRTIGYEDLADNGEWVLVENHYYWRPTVVVDYVPYRTGYWSYVPAVGSVWIETYPFGYITTHYGRWHHFDHYGWVWGYDPVWSPAWAATVRCGDYFVWAPVDYDCRPVRVSASTCFAVGGLDFYVSACSYVPATYVYTSPWYVAPIAPTVVNYIVTNPTNVYIWNIERYPSPRLRIPYQNSLPMVRDYNPPRSIRGISYYNNSGMLARSRVEELEGSFALKTSSRGFRGQSGLPSSVLRTSMSGDRPTSFRNVKLNTTSPRPTSVRFSPDGISSRSSMDRLDSMRGKEINTDFTRAIERTPNNIRDGGMPSIRGKDTGGVGRSSNIPETRNVNNNIGLDRQGRNSTVPTPGRSGNVPSKEMNIPSLSRLDMDGERKPRDYNNPSSSGGSTTSPRRTTPRNDSGTGSSRDSDRVSPRSTPTDRSNPGRQITPRGSSLNWDNPGRNSSDIRALGSTKQNNDATGRTSIPDFDGWSSGSSRGRDNTSVRKLNEASTKSPFNRSTNWENPSFSVNRSQPSIERFSSTPNIRRNSNAGLGDNNRSLTTREHSSGLNTPSISRSAPSVPSFNHSNTVRTNPITDFHPSAPSSIDTPKFGHSSPSFSTPSNPSFSRPSFSTPSKPSFSRPSFSTPSIPSPSISRPSGFSGGGIGGGFGRGIH